MSHLIADPFHRPSPFDVQQTVHPLTPPDTESERIGPPVPKLSTVSLPTEVDNVFGRAGGPTSDPETPGSRFRRTSNIVYRSSGLRESRERSIQRSSKTLVVVVPPIALSQQHGQLGHTLASGPRHRLTQGILMPLFPTIYGQLVAIAREFNFPSTVGLCLYLQVTENGITVTPRISEESWHFLWGHLFEPNSPTLTQTPISGRIEFDIDLRQARWYDVWLSSFHREIPDMSYSVASRSQSISHTPGNSRTTFGEDHSAYEYSEDVYPTQYSRTPRRIPRRLSLIERFEPPSNRPVTMPPVILSPPDADQPQTVHTSTPVVQDEPKTAKQDLELRVNNWRASSTLNPSSLVAKGQTSLEPANIPNTIALNSADAPGDDAESTLNLDDFTWSISSVGPPSDDGQSPLSSVRIQSVHMDRRNQGSVCLTPTTCTSSGPSDYDIYSPVSSIFRLPSPDLGLRMIEDSPPTPSTATSWGPPSPALSLALSDDRPPSIDIGLRCVFSAPVTPSTATSWGPPLSYPPSPATPFYVRTPDVGQRSFFADETPSMDISNLIFPNYNVWKGKPWNQVWPYRQPDTADETPDSPFLNISNHIFPKYDAWKGRPWNQVWPYRHTDEVLDAQAAKDKTSNQTCTSLGYPSFVIYRPVYPHFDIYPAISTDNTKFDEPLSTRLPAKYPSLDIYHWVYPHLEIYPATFRTIQTSVGDLSSRSMERIDVKSRVTYPLFNLYPAVYPWNLLEIYPSSMANHDMPSSVHLEAVYPSFGLYPAQYPHFTIYPPCELSIAPFHKEGSELATLHPKSRTLSQTTSDASTVTSIASLSEQRFASQAVRLEVSNPVVAIPHLLSPYAYVSVGSVLYPKFDLYPAIAHSAQYSTPSMSSGYPVFNLYPAIYPYFDLYPVVQPNLEPQSFAVESLTDVGEQAMHVGFKFSRDYSDIVGTSLPYPAFDLYPAVYPYFNLYPALHHQTETPASVQRSNDDITNKIDARYPNFNIYPPVYPYFDIYASGSCQSLVDETDHVIIVRLPALYPRLVIYPAVYPHFDLWPSIVSSSPIVARARRRTHDELHALVMAETPVIPQSITQARRRTHDELHALVMAETPVIPQSVKVNHPQQPPQVPPISAEPVIANFEDPVPALNISKAGANKEHSFVQNAERPLKPILRRVSLHPDAELKTSHYLVRPLPPVPKLGHGVSSPQTPANYNRPLSRVYGLPSGPADMRHSLPPRLRSAHPSLDSQWRAGMPDVPEDVNDATTHRNALSSHQAQPESGKKALDRSKSDGSVHRSTRTRDSLVSQRVKVYGGASEPVQITMETLSQFPMPPTPPVPPLPPVAKLDRFKSSPS